MNIELVIPKLPESYNKILKFTGWDREAYQNEWYAEVNAAWIIWCSMHGGLPKNLPLNEAKVIFTFFFPDKRIRDHINMAGGAKYALDALVYFKIIQSDQWYPKRFVDDFYIPAYDKLKPRTEILIAEEESASQIIQRMLEEALTEVEIKETQNNVLQRM